jgi:Arc/MetJ-type ribon-helix-helix transcriptional regulator
MGAVLEVQISDDLKSIIDRQVAEGRAASGVDFLREAAVRYAEHLDAEEELEEIARAGIAAAEAGDYILIETEADAEALFQRTMARVRSNLASDYT